MEETKTKTLTANVTRVCVLVTGAVQGVGFRPFVYRLNQALGLTGWVANTSAGVIIEAEGGRKEIEVMLFRLRDDAPPNSDLQSADWVELEPAGYTSFEIRESDASGFKTARVLPDLSVCPECLEEIFNPENRRHLYPFTNCTHCGPRFSIIEGLPYDRPYTTMRSFTMCEACRKEYEDPSNRRFHAEPNACPECGPALELWNGSGEPVSAKGYALKGAVEAIRSGRIVAVKGVGGFHLLVDATNDGAVRKLRERKRRGGKPFAVMFPDLASLRRACEVSPAEEKLLLSPMAPIVILNRSEHKDVIARSVVKRRSNLIIGLLCRPFGPPRNDNEVSNSVAPGNPTIGAMLPYSPLHTILMREIKAPVVATSGNISEEPICFDEKEVVERLGGMADLFLVHNRPIARPMDDSVVRVVMGEPFLIRGGRGYAPISISLNEKSPAVIGAGAHMKNTVAITAGDSVFISQHLGDLEAKPSVEAYLKAKESMMNLYDVDPVAVATDLHPDYFSTQNAKESGLEQIPVQHHHAHIVSCMAEHGLQSRVLGVAWDGTGLGTDGLIWGSEFLVADRSRFNRVGHFRNFRLPGGNAAALEPRRSALGLLFEIFGAEVFKMKKSAPVRSFSSRELKVLKTMLLQETNSPLTSSAGRLFDAVSSLVGLKQISGFEGDAPLSLEFAGTARTGNDGFVYNFPLEAGGKGSFVFNWEPMIREIITDLKNRVPAGIISNRFHDALVGTILALAEKIKIREVVLSGGCFQNKYLLEKAAAKLKEAGFKPYWPKRVPVNDGGISLGQAAAALARLKEKV